nr:hypothetical protein [Desulfobulbaceae bacterium]
MKNEYNETFSIDGLDYSLNFLPEGTVNFCVVSGKFKDGKRVPLVLDNSDPYYYWWSEDDNVAFSSYNVKNRTKNPVKVVREVARRIFGYVSRRHPSRIAISCLNPAKKRIVDRYMRKGIPSGYNFYIEGTTYHFIRAYQTETV